MKTHNITVYKSRVGLVCDRIPYIDIGDLVKINNVSTGHTKVLYVDPGDYNNTLNVGCDCSCALYDKDTGCGIKCAVSLVDERTGHDIGEGYTSFCSGTASDVKLRHIDDLMEGL